MRTYLLKAFEEKNSAINRNFTHALFVNEQFLTDNAYLINSKSEALTRDIYVNNSYKGMFNYRMKHVPDVVDDYKDFFTSSSCIFLYSFFETYIEDIFDLVGEIRGSKCKKKNNTSTLESLFLCLGSTVTSNLNQNEMDTLDYIRLRRNSIVHAEGKPSPTLSILVTSKGANLNHYWQKDFRLYGLDFSLATTAVFTEKELIDLIRLTRKLAFTIDRKVLSLLNNQDIISYLLREFKIQFASDIKQRTRSKLERKFAKFVKMRFNIEEKDINFATLVF
jgi:hypothetical protein